MNCDYADIRERIKEEPLWFDEAAVPRYVHFSPDHLSDIYAREAALVLIACQACQKRFKVAFARNDMDDIRAARDGQEPRTIAAQIRQNVIHYGDPPNVGCCPAGPTMNSDPLRVLEYWLRNAATDHEWRRDESLEIDVSEDALVSTEQSGG